MKVLLYRPPCDERGEFSAWLDALRNQSGAYIIRSRRSHETLYVGESHTGNLAKTLKRHFYTWRDDPERIHHTYDRHAVETAVGAQDNLIRRLAPRDNGYTPVKQPF